MKEIFTEIFSNLAIASPEVAEAAAASEGPGIESLFIQLIIIFVIFYFILIRPQQKKHKAQEQMTKTLKKGDNVVTISGVLGTVKKATEGDRFIELEIAENTVIKVLRSSVGESLDEKIKKASSTASEKEKPAKKNRVKKKTDTKAEEKKAEK